MDEEVTMGKYLESCLNECLHLNANITVTVATIILTRKRGSCECIAT